MLRALCFALLLSAIAPAGAAWAQQEKGLFGVGLIVGEPSGVSVKYYLSDDTAVDGAAGVGLIDTGFHVHGDFLWHPWVLESQDTFVLPMYLGPGLRFLLSEAARGQDDVMHFGVRGVVGALFDFRKIPLDVFLEVAPILEYKLSDNDDESGFGVAINAAAGVRYYF